MANQHKFRALVHYVLSKRQDSPDTLGAVKLNKVLWLSDLNSFYEFGEPITESRYIKRQYGPVPAGIVPTLREMERDGLVSIRNSDHFGKTKKEYVLHSISNGEFLDAHQRKLVDKMIDFVCDRHTASSVSNATHDHIWHAAADGEELPLYTVFAVPGTITDAEREWAKMVIESESA